MNKSWKWWGGVILTAISIGLTVVSVFNFFVETPKPLNLKIVLPTSTPMKCGESWSVEFYNNLDLEGLPKVNDCRPKVWLELDEDQNPHPGVNIDFSSRWTRVVYFETATHQLCVISDDGVRVNVDGLGWVINRWYTQVATKEEPHCVKVEIETAGWYQINVEHFDKGGPGYLDFWYDKYQPSTPTPMPKPTLTPTPFHCPKEQWKATFFNNVQLEVEPAASECYPRIDFNWEYGSPAPEVNATEFSSKSIRRMGRKFCFLMPGVTKWLNRGSWILPQRSRQGTTQSWSSTTTETERVPSPFQTEQHPSSPKASTQKIANQSNGNGGQEGCNPFLLRSKSDLLEGNSKRN
jgi:hypothetical protein